MAQEGAQSEPIDVVLKGLREDLKSIKGEIKGIKGQQGLIRAKIGLGRPGQVEKEPETSHTEAPTTQSKPEEAHKMHEIFEWMRDCPNCGGKNLDYKPPTVACANCGVPLSSSPDVKKELVETKKTDKVTHCWNCGKSAADNKEGQPPVWQVKVV
jgi:hypothetical protein